ncbi:MAG: restriction endonuclease subunit S [Deltaproteobacteria bacterium]|jgi:type I restriction enzyme S subunit|nr:restriction endonuclease subunit S [Deltaproteobacteria bacterium]
MELKKGYKQTEVGVIPEDWEIFPLGELFSFSGGHTASRDQLSGDGFCYLHYGDIHKSNKTYMNVKNEYQEIPKLNVPIKMVSQKSLLNDGDVVFVDASEDDEGASKHIVVQNQDETTYISGLHTIVSKSKNDYVYNGYKQHCFQTADVKRQFKFYAVGTKVSGISKANIAKIQIPLPPTKAEQTAIAAALSDADALIQSLEKLIAKKRLIKQGAMQELLKPKKGWMVKKLGEICDFQNGTSLERLFNKNEGYSVISIGNYSSSGNYVETNTFIDNVHFDEIAKFLLKKNELTLLMNDKTSIGTIIGRVLLIEQDDKYVFNQRTMRLKPKNNYNSLFLYHLINSGLIHKKIVLLAKPGTQIYVNTNDIIDLELFIPKPEEQTAIATILADMDAEISAIETNLAKYKLIKQGMMQELLTGRTRLV